MLRVMQALRRILNIAIGGTEAPSTSRGAQRFSSCTAMPRVPSKHALTFLQNN